MVQSQEPAKIRDLIHNFPLPNTTYNTKSASDVFFKHIIYLVSTTLEFLDLVFCLPKDARHDKQKKDMVSR